MALTFCPDCGSQVTIKVSFRPEMTFFTAGTLDDVSVVHPGRQLWCDSAQPWVESGGEIEPVAESPV